jgi:hypothetical protein
MSDTGKIIILGSIAAALTVGAVQFASGHDLTAGLIGAETTSSAVNRSAKADRAQLPAAPEQTKTITLQLAQFADTSFLLRIPANPTAAAGEAKRSTASKKPASPVLIESDGGKGVKRPVACEPSVSVLTEIAKRLQPGRCVT